MRRRAWRWGIGAALALGLASAIPIALFAEKRSAAPGTAEGDRAWPVRCAVAEERAVPDEVSGFGSISYRRKLDVSAPCDALVAALPFREGDEARAGDIVARLESRLLVLEADRARHEVSEAEAALDLATARLREGELSALARLMSADKAGLEIAEAERQLAESRRKLADQELLFEAGAVAEETIKSARFALETEAVNIALMAAERDIALVGLRAEDLARAGLPVPEDPSERREAFVEFATADLEAERRSSLALAAACRKALEAAEEAVSELTIRAPSACTVGARYVEEGERVEAARQLLTLMEVDELFAVVSVSEADAVRLARGMKALVTVDALRPETGDRGLEGVVDIVSPVADASSASCSVRIAIAGGRGSLRPGMFVRAVISLGASRACVAVPPGAMVGSGDGARVFVVTGGMASVRMVTDVETLDDGWLAAAGIEPGSVVILDPEPGLKEGDRVEISE